MQRNKYAFLSIDLLFQSKLFWILVRSLKDFLATDSDGWLPVPGVLPDMTAETAHYINLQNIYRSQANYDALLGTQTIR